MNQYQEIFANGVNSESIARAGELARANIHFTIDCLYAATFFTPEIMIENIYPYTTPNIEDGLFSNAYETFINAAWPKHPHPAVGVPMIFGTGGEEPFGEKVFKDIWDASFEKKYIIGTDPYDEKE